MPSISVEHYLKAIYRLGGEKQPVSLTDLSKELSVSLPSVSQMVRKLAKRSLVTHKPYTGVSLTPAGRDHAIAVTRRHRLWERFLTDVLGLGWDQVHQEACLLEHATSLVVEERLAEFLGWPETCPHGHPVPTLEGEIADEAGRPLSELDAGAKAVILSVPEESELLQYLGRLGLVPQAEVLVEAVAPFDGPLTIRVGNSQRAIGRKVASRVIVRHQGPHNDKE